MSTNINITSKEGAQYFQVTVQNATEALLVELTALTGDPDLYLSYTQEKPSATDYQFRGISFESDAATIPVQDLLPNQPLFIAVVAPLGPASGSLVAMQEPKQFLSDGVPQAGSVDKGATKFYSLRQSGKRPAGAYDGSRGCVVGGGTLDR